MNKKYLNIILVISALLACLFTSGDKVKAEENTHVETILLAYNSKNVRQNGQNNVTLIQEMLTGAGVKVHVQKIAEYKKDTMTKYDGVVTLINWSEREISNKDFIADRTKFTGKKLHIGTGLMPDELKSLDATKTTLYRRQLLLTLPEISSQILSYTTNLDILNANPQSEKIGQIKVQGVDNIPVTPLITIHNQSGYLPIFDGQGIPFVAATHIIGKMFGKKQLYQPLLLIEGVTPYTDLKILRKLSEHLALNFIPFALSVSSVQRNTELNSFKKFTSALRYIEGDNGAIFIRTPEVGYGKQEELSIYMNNTLTVLAQHHVFPFGLSFPGYWQLDHYYKDIALKNASHVIQLPTEEEKYLKQDNEGIVFDEAFTTIKGSSFIEDRYGKPIADQDVDFGLPVTISYKMPENEKQLALLERKVKSFKWKWQNPMNLNTELDVGMTKIQYHNGNYKLNGYPVEFDLPEHIKPPKTVEEQEWYNKFFEYQSKFMWIFFGIVLTIMISMIFVGRAIYLEMYKRK